MREHSLQAVQLTHLGKSRIFGFGRRVEVLAVVVVVVVVDVVVLGISSIVVGRVGSSAMRDFSSGVIVEVDVVEVGVVSGTALSKRISCCDLLGPDTDRS